MNCGTCNWFADESVLPDRTEFFGGFMNKSGWRAAMKTLPRSLAVLALALGACSSAPVHFYTLVKPAAPVDGAAAAAFAIAVQPVSLPAQVDMPQLVVRQGPGALALIESEQWIAPLSDELRAALAAELGARLGVVDVYRLPRNAAVPVYRIQFDVQRFESTLAQSARIEALWTIQPPEKNSPQVTCASRVSESVGEGYAALVEGHQRALAKIAENIAQVFTSAKPPNALGACPSSS